MDLGPNLYLIDVDFYGSKGFPLSTLSLTVAQVNYQWKMLVKHNHLLHWLTMLEWVFQAILGVWYGDLASPEEAELMPESTQWFSRRAPEKICHFFWKGWLTLKY